MKQGSVENLPSMPPQVVEVPRKGYREFYLLEDTWNAGIFLLIGIRAKQYTEWTKERFGISDDKLDDTKNGTARWVTYNGATYEIITIGDAKWTWRRSQWCVLVHELHHVVTSILNRKGITHSGATEECWAYLQDSLLNRFVWALGNRRKVLQRPKAPKKRPLARKPRRK